MNFLSKLFGRNKVKKPSDITSREGEPDVYRMSVKNERIEWGIEKAQLTLHYFEECLKSRNTEKEYFSAKVAIEDNDHTEHIWVIDPSFDDEGNMFGVIGNIPVNVKSVKLNQRIGIERSLITDWMIVREGRLIGGYTIRAIREGLKGNELAQFNDEMGGTIIDDGEDYFKADFSTPEGAIISIENAYNDNDLEKVLACRSFRTDAEIMALKKLKSSSEEIITELALGLKYSIIAHIQKNGMPDFKNVIRAFPKREKLSDKHWIITEVVYFPDGRITEQRINTYLTDEGWRVSDPEY